MIKVVTAVAEVYFWLGNCGPTSRNLTTKPGLQWNSVRTLLCSSQAVTAANALISRWPRLPPTAKLGIRNPTLLDHVVQGGLLWICMTVKVVQRIAADPVVMKWGSNCSEEPEHEEDKQPSLDVLAVAVSLGRFALNNIFNSNSNKSSESLWVAYDSPVRCSTQGFVIDLTFKQPQSLEW